MVKLIVTLCMFLSLNSMSQTISETVKLVLKNNKDLLEENMKLLKIFDLYLVAKNKGMLCVITARISSTLDSINLGKVNSSYVNNKDEFLCKKSIDKLLNYCLYNEFDDGPLISGDINNNIKQHLNFILQRCN